MAPRPDHHRAVGVDRGGVRAEREIRRLWVTVPDSRAEFSLVAKFEPTEKIRRAWVVQSHVGETLFWGLAMALGVHLVSADDDLAVLLVEDIRPAGQGDELATIACARAEELMTIVAGMHRVPVDVDGRMERWSPRVVEDAMPGPACSAWLSTAIRMCSVDGSTIASPASVTTP